MKGSQLTCKTGSSVNTDQSEKMATNPAKMNRYAELVISALGMTTICSFWIVAPLVSESHNAVYHWSERGSSLFCPAIMDFCICWFALTLILLLARKPGRSQIAVWSTFLFFIPWVIAKEATFLSTWYMPHWISLTLFSASLAAVLSITAFWRPRYQKKIDGAREFIVSILTATACVGILVLAQLIWYASKADSLNIVTLSHTKMRKPVDKGLARPRIIWIVLDELSYQQVYEQRFKGLQLPTFDSIADESTVFTHVIPAGITTEIVLPSLITGEPIDKISASADGKQLSVHYLKPARWKLFDQHDSIFQDALNSGYKTSVSGWYNPYCRILPEVLDSCFWTFRTTALSEPYLSHFALALARFAKMLKPQSMVVDESSDHILDYRSIYEVADQMLNDKSNGFLLIHMPIPHPGGIYNRMTGKITEEGSNYLDNLVLADKYLAHVRSFLEQTGQWNSSAIIIMGDHSWRTQLLWSFMPGWTHEEQVASNGGLFDDRPAYIIKLPNQHIGTLIQAPFAATNTRRMLDEILQERIRSSQALTSWVAGLK
jgi:Sulfatase